MNKQEIADNHKKLRSVLEENGELDQNPIYGPNWVLIQPTQEALDIRSKTSYYHIGNKICKLCKIEFDYGKTNLTNCYEHTFYCICSACENAFSRSAIGEIKESIVKLSPVTAYCSRSCVNVAVHESIRRKRAEDPEYNAKCVSRLRENVKHAHAAYQKLWNDDPEWRENQREILAENGRKIGSENAKYAHAALADLRNDPEWSAKMSKISAENVKHAHAALANLWKDPEWAAEQREKIAEIGRKYGPENGAENVKYATAAYKKLLKNDPEFRESMRKIHEENIKYANAANKELWNDPEWAAEQRERIAEMGRKYGPENVKHAIAANKELWNDPEWAAKMSKISAENVKHATAARLDALINRFASINISFDGRSLTYSDAASYRNVVGAIGLTGIYKGDKPGIPDSDIGTRFALTAGMRSDLGEEIRTFASILAQPEKQISADDELALPNPPSNPDFGRWYDITNYYEDFEIILLASDVDPEDARAAEAAWAIQNSALFRENPHGYWLP